MFHPLARKAHLLQIALGLAIGCSGCHGTQGRHDAWPEWPDLTSWWQKTPQMHTPEPTTMPTAEQQQNTQLLIARSLEQRGDIDGAIHAYEQISKKRRDCGGVHHRLAVLHDQNGDHEQAVKHYKQALAKSKNKAAILTDFGYSYYLQGDLESAEKHLREAVRLDPNSERAHNNLGLVLARTERRDEALTAFFRAGSSAADAHINLAYALMWERKFNEAEEELRMVLNRWPDSNKAQNALVAMGRATTKADGGPAADLRGVEQLASARRTASRRAPTAPQEDRVWLPEPRTITQEVPSRAAPLATGLAPQEPPVAYTAARPVETPRRIPAVTASASGTYR